MKLVSELCVPLRPAKVRHNILQRLFSSQNPSKESIEQTLTPVIGLEIHAQLHCKTKLFSGAPYENDAPCNSRVALFDMATPGTLPRLNRRSVEQCLRASLLLNCRIADWCRFDRKHYFYPDMPLGYQITQKDHPIAEDGYMDFYVYAQTPFFSQATSTKNKSEKHEIKTYLKRLRIERLQLEMDSGKVLKYYDNDNATELVDLNRAGVSLAEIVTAPELSSALEAACFVEQLRALLFHNDICQGEMHKGQLRVDANISISVNERPGTRTEIKNLNSFRFLQNAINDEISRQRQILLSGGVVAEETRTLDSENLKTVAVREKNDALDYRFIPEPNLPRLIIEKDWVNALQQNISFDVPHLSYIREYGFSPSFALQLVKNETLKTFVDECYQNMRERQIPIIDFQLFYNWLKEFKRICEQNGYGFPLKKKILAHVFSEIICLENGKKLTRALSLDLLKDYVLLVATDADIVPLYEKIENENLWRIHDKFIFEQFTKKIIDEHPTVVEKVKKIEEKRGNKHFNRLRNEIVFASQKRIAVEDAESTLIAWFNQF